MVESARGIFGAAFDAVPYQAICREERHYAAVLFALMNADLDGLQTLLDKIAKLAGCTAEPAGECRLFFEYAKPRDLWSGLKTDAQRRAVILAGLERFGWTPVELPSAPFDFNRHFSIGGTPANKQIASPATWVQTRDADAAEVLLKKAFKIKPDIVIERDGVPVVCIEAKLESKESVEGGINQIQRQREMFEKLLGAEPVMVLLAPKASRGEDCRISWSTAFDCFPKYRDEPWVRDARAFAASREKGTA